MDPFDCRLQWERMHSDRMISLYLNSLKNSRKHSLTKVGRDGRIIVVEMMIKGVDEKRTINESLDLAWSLLRMMPRTMLKVWYRRTSVSINIDYREFPRQCWMSTTRGNLWFLCLHSSEIIHLLLIILFNQQEDNNNDKEELINE